MAITEGFRLSACKICGGLTEVQGFVDAGRSCEINHGTYLPLTLQPVLYQRCLTCCFIFTTACDHWTIGEFRDHIYNAGYAAVDPEYFDGARAARNVGVVIEVASQINATRILDYGGGDGRLVALLRQQSEIAESKLVAASWDPILDSEPLANAVPYDLVTAFEVWEHVPDPHATMREALRFLRPGGVLLVSTLLHEIPRQNSDFWYIAPRNGHLSIHSPDSLTRLFAVHGLSVTSLAPGLHYSFRPTEVTPA